MTYIEDANRDISTMIAAIRDDSAIPSYNKDTTKEYANFMKARGLASRTISKNLYCLSVFLKAIDNKKMLALTKRDMENAFALIEGSKYSDKTKQNIKVTIKSLYKHFLGDDLRYPDQVLWIKTTLKSSKRMLPEDILTEDEIEKMVESANNLRDKAIIALLFDAGIRIGELVTLRLKDINLNSEPAHITVNGKTGMRQIPLFFSVPYLANYINTQKKLGPTDTLTHGEGSWSVIKKRVDYGAIRMMLKRTAIAAGIKKRIYPHLFRHSRASNYANKLTEQQLKVFFGWSGASRMAATYVHLSGRDIDNAVLEANGVKQESKTEEPHLRIKNCPRCQLPNEMTSIYCTRCGTALDIDMAMKLVQSEANMKNMLIESLSDPSVLKQLLPVIKEVLKEKAK